MEHKASCMRHKSKSAGPVGKDLLVSVTVSAPRNHVQGFPLLCSCPFSFLLELDVLVIKILRTAKCCFTKVNDCNFNNILENIISKGQFMYLDVSTKFKR